MLTSLHNKVSTLVHRRTRDRAAQDGDIQDANFVPNDDAVVNTNPSINWDFTIVFKGAKDLPRGDLLSSDPFLEAYLGPPEDKESLSFVTGVQWSTLNPEWNATWHLLNVTDGMMMQILVKDKNKMMVDTDLGRASMLLGAKLEGVQEHVLDIWRSDDHKQGQIIIQTTGVRCAGKSAALTKASTKGPARYSRHTSYAAGVLTREKTYEFYTYRIRLYHLFDVFGTDERYHQHWNTEYDAAKRIFADNLEGLNIRNALHSQHSYLYRHGRNTIYDSLATAEDWGKLLHGDRLKKDPNQDLKTVVFTYSIVPKGFYFSETGTAFFQDFMSKHAMHANRAQQVMYSGEFRLFRDKLHNDDWTLLIDNNSGTYAPKKEDLLKLKELFELNFPDLVVMPLDHEDPYLKEIREATKQIEAAQASQQTQRLTLFGAISSKSGQEVMQVHGQENDECQA
ncbi:hypothetical protein BC939DRAFT_446643 [Gamsiella multidivaricata]|uniref:uncharacterized protein n=1 Tax=Gamsiella multidivaricata TaxID=101098 RepID=UPI0022208288|nr:uncharacterized protein BC939DRAFT_446643 [Gamsiella multidivaricata]KAG0370526.1 hypothetical protein BGZ54_005909 [Gamsiella multidivaricata]KAI7826519.1 hypothetical protein BC939DRAFT_446643 [Gamsiella multidivaricata]